MLGATGPCGSTRPICCVLTLVSTHTHCLMFLASVFCHDQGHPLSGVLNPRNCQNNDPSVFEISRCPLPLDNTPHRPVLVGFGPDQLAEPRELVLGVSYTFFPVIVGSWFLNIMMVGSLQDRQVLVDLHPRKCSIIAETGVCLFRFGKRHLCGTEHTIVKRTWS